MKKIVTVIIVLIFLFVFFKCPKESRIDFFLQETGVMQRELSQLRVVINSQIPFIPEKVVLFGEKVPLGQFSVRERLLEALIYEKNNQEMINIFLRSGRWFSMIEKKASLANFPEDLKYLIVAESALKPTAGSRKGAGGLAQFIKGTSRKYLEINRYIDERYDPEVAIEAAINHLKDLYKEFGNWSMAIAGYNMHKDRFSREVSNERAKNFYEVKDIPLETQRYVFRIIATKLIMENPERYGYPEWKILDIWGYKSYPIKARVVIIRKRREKIVDLAQRLGMTYYEFRTFNPQIKVKRNRYGEVVRGYLPKGKYKIYVKIKGVL